MDPTQVTSKKADQTADQTENDTSNEMGSVVDAFGGLTAQLHLLLFTLSSRLLVNELC